MNGLHRIVGLLTLLVLCPASWAAAPKVVSSTVEDGRSDDRDAREREGATRSRANWELA
jgi:hypothetical protein